MRNVWQLMKDNDTDLRKEKNGVNDEVVSEPDEERDDCNSYNGSNELLSLQLSSTNMSGDDTTFDESISVSDTADDFCSSEIHPGGYQDWGTNRRIQENSKKSRGFPWTVKELEIVREWKVLNPSGNIKCCLEDIYANEHFRREFHVHHVINSTRLQTAWKRV